jgi:pimeloyl-ACP methyl ester carboxylesterase
MEIVIGVVLALGATVFARATGFDRDRSFYAVVVAIVASYYDLFAAVGGDPSALAAELAVTAVFIGLAVIGFRTSLWVVAFALLAHGLFDLVHGRFIENPGVPAWWPAFCGSYDAAAAGLLAWLLLTARVQATRPGFGGAIRPFVQAELAAAEDAERAGDAAGSFRRLERAHVLGQASTREHVRVHLRMFAWAVRHRHAGEVVGQLIRVVGAAALTGLGLVPHGNTGGSDVSPVKAMAIPDDLARAIAAARTAARGALSPATLVATLLAASACSTTPDDVRVAAVEDRQIAYRVLGSGEPVIVMIAGLGDGMATFESVASDLSQSATVIVYDRPGYGASDMAQGARDAAAAERDLTALLAQSGVPGPYVLAGHSLGGAFAEHYAARHPEQIAGLILEESRPADFTRRCEAAAISNCTPPAALASLMPRGARGELAAMATTMDEVAAAGPAEGKRVLVLSRPVAPDAQPFDALWSTAQVDLAARYPGARHLTADGGGHSLHRDQRAWYVGAVRAFLDELR